MRLDRLRSPTSGLTIAAILAVLYLVTGIVAPSSGAHTSAALGRSLASQTIAPADWQQSGDGSPTGQSYRLWEQWGGFWADAEKDPNPGDDKLCWAATTANMLEWTGWGFVGPNSLILGGTDEFFQFFRSHVSDKGNLVPYGIEWWFHGELNDG